MAKDRNNLTGEEKPSAEGGMSEREIDETLEASFPASDPPSWTLGTDHGEEEGEEKKSP